MQKPTGNMVGVIGSVKRQTGDITEGILGFVIFFTLVFSGCALPSQEAHVYGKGSPAFAFDLSQPIYVVHPKVATENDKAFHALLVGEMKRLGFRVANQLSQETLVLFSD